MIAVISSIRQKDLCIGQLIINKGTTAPKLSKGFYLACEDIEPAKKWVVYARAEQYKTKDDITLTLLVALMQQLQEIG